MNPWDVVGWIVVAALVAPVALVLFGLITVFIGHVVDSIRRHMRRSAIRALKEEEK